MAEFKCPRCGHEFRGEPCRSCVGRVKAYECQRCGNMMANPFWNGGISDNEVQVR